jgi:DNA-binding transcriptional LysR family regulator
MHCEHEGATRAALAQHGCDVAPSFASERDDWILALVAAGRGFALMPALSAPHPGVAALRLIEPQLARDIALVTVRGRPDAPALGSLAHEIARLHGCEAAEAGLRIAADYPSFICASAARPMRP